MEHLSEDQRQLNIHVCNQVRSVPWCSFSSHRTCCYRTVMIDDLRLRFHNQLQPSTWTDLLSSKEHFYHHRLRYESYIVLICRVKSNNAFLNSTGIQLVLDSHTIRSASR